MTNRRSLTRTLLLVIAATAVPAISTTQPEPVRPAVSLEPIAAILDAFGSHPVVALSDGAVHRDENGHAFRLALLRHPRFASTINDIVVAWGNAIYQDVMDRYVSGEDVPSATLRRVWQNTTQPGAGWDVPIYEECYRAVRSLNSPLPKERQVRVLLGDPPIDWEHIRTMDDNRKWMSNPHSGRDRFPAELIRREVLAKNRRALIVYGAMHFAAGGGGNQAAMQRGQVAEVAMSGWSGYISERADGGSQTPAGEMVVEHRSIVQESF